MNWIVIIAGIIAVVIGVCAEHQKGKTAPALRIEPIQRINMPKSVLINNTWMVEVDSWEEHSTPGSETFIRVYGDIENVRDGVIPLPYKGEIVGVSDVTIRLTGDIADYLNEEGALVVDMEDPRLEIDVRRVR